MSLSKLLFACHLMLALSPLAHIDPASVVASSQAWHRGTFVVMPPTPPPSPSSMHLVEPLASLAPSHLELHNRILTLLTPDQPDLDEASLFTRHVLHSNCRPSSFTCVAVLNTLLSAHCLDDFMLHRFSIQAIVPPTAATHALYLSAFTARRLPDIALDHLLLVSRPGSPVPPSPISYRVVFKCLVANHGCLTNSIELKDQMLASWFVKHDPHVYNILMAAFVEAGNGAKPMELYQDLLDKVGGELVLDGGVYGSLMKAYFLMEMEETAMECYKEVLDAESKVRFGADSYNEVVDALGKNNMLEDAVKLFDRMLREHDPLLRVVVYVRSFILIVDAYCAAMRFDDAITMFRRMREWKVVPNVAAYNNMI